VSAITFEVHYHAFVVVRTHKGYDRLAHFALRLDGVKISSDDLMEKKRELVRRADVDELIDGICGVVLTHLSSMPPRCAPRGDLAIRRSIERVVFEVRTEIATVCQHRQGGEAPSGTTQAAFCQYFCSTTMVPMARSRHWSGLP
jgi:hypothetical protein